MIRNVRNSKNPNQRELVQDHGERIEKDDLDVEEDEEHRGQVEADGEALPLRRPLRDAGLERDRPGAHAPVRPLGEDEAADHHRCRDLRAKSP